MNPYISAPKNLLYFSLFYPFPYYAFLLYKPVTWNRHRLVKIHCYLLSLQSRRSNTFYEVFLQYQEHN